MRHKINRPTMRRFVINWLYKNNYSDTKDLSNCEIKELSGNFTDFISSKKNVCEDFYWWIKNNHPPECKKPKDREHKTASEKQKERKEFYSSNKWREIRVQILVEQNRKCCLCGRSPKEGIILHVDHIKPRSKYPELELEKSNLQILCEDCNMGKSNYYEEDWR